MSSYTIRTIFTLKILHINKQVPVKDCVFETLTRSSTMVAAGVLLVLGGISRRVDAALDCCDWFGMFLMNVNLWGNSAWTTKVDTAVFHNAFAIIWKLIRKQLSTKNIKTIRVLWNPWCWKSDSRAEHLIILLVFWQGADGTVSEHTLFRAEHCTSPCPLIYEKEMVMADILHYCLFPLIFSHYRWNVWCGLLIDKVWCSSSGYTKCK